MRRSPAAALVGAAIAWCAVSSANVHSPGKEHFIKQLTPQEPFMAAPPTLGSRPTLDSPAPTLGAPPPLAAPRRRDDRVLAAAPSLPSATVKVQFEYDSDRLTPEGVAALVPLGEALQDPRLKDFRFLIAGHTDAKGSDRYNETLSQRRARAVREHLIATYRVEPRRLTAKGFGRRQLADPSRPEDPINRRVEVVNLGGFSQGAATGGGQGPAISAPPPR